MSQRDLYASCRVGDIESVRFLLDFKDVELNCRDQWDGTALYYACLCGHEQLVQFLLSNGARCEANTFDGERCLYAALNDNIRALLKDYKAITSQCMRRDSFKEFLRRCLEDGKFYDLVFNVHGREFHVHRVILSARSDYLRNMLSGKWKERRIIYLNHSLVKPHAFAALLQYIYTERLDISLDNIDDCIRLARQCHLHHLKSRLEKQRKESMTLVASKPGTRINIISVEPDLDASQLMTDFSVLASVVVGGEHLMCDSSSMFSDVCICVDDQKYYCHKVFLCGRSDYFRALLTGNFSEAISLMESLPVDTDHTTIPEVALHDVASPVLSLVLNYIYCQQVDVSPDVVFPLLSAANMYLLPGLPKVCCMAIAPRIAADNVINILAAARLFEISRLEMQCAKVIADQLEQLIDNKELAAIIKEDAETIRKREETDSVPLVDDIRFHIMNLPISEDKKQYKFAVLDGLLEMLGIEC